jgi:hypothetical protein
MLLKDLPVQDVAAFGGWKTPRVAADLYQKTDRASRLRVVNAGVALRQAQVAQLLAQQVCHT